MNRLAQAASPYLRQHAGNPVDWYPWGEEAFRRAREEDKPIFLSIGYSTCHWCHVMARESFEDREIAALLNAHFVAVKVDREERPDIDSIYMAVCQAFTGSGGWPTTVFITADQRPFFAGTYFPKTSRYGTPGLKELLEIIADRWKNDRAELLRAAGKDVEVTMLTRGGETLHGHILSEQTRFNILFGHYDWVILQEATGDFQRETDQELPAESKAASQAEKIEL